MYSRKNQAALSSAEWSDLIAAMEAIHALAVSPPHYQDFVEVHVEAMDITNAEGMSWGVHTMGRRMPGRNFLAWHRLFLLKFEERLRQVKPNVTIPYWDSLGAPALPSQLSVPSLLTSWGVTRNFNASELPNENELTAAVSQKNFKSFQRILEAGVHAAVHNAVGGTMSTSFSPRDPIFWLHHCNLDRIWARWEDSNAGKNPPNMAETLKPPPIFTKKVSDVVSIAALGYNYV
jgi:tyrosinase